LFIYNNYYCVFLKRYNSGITKTGLGFNAVVLLMKKSAITDRKIAGSLRGRLYGANRKFTTDREPAGKFVKMDKKSETFGLRFFNSLWVKLLFILFSFRGYDPGLTESLFRFFKK
jgi:hypothetical protein